MWVKGPAQSWWGILKEFLRILLSLWVYETMFLLVMLDPSTVYSRDRLSWCMNLSQIVSVSMNTSAHQKMGQIPGLSQRVHHQRGFQWGTALTSNQQDVCRWTSRSERRMSPETPVLVSSLYLKKKKGNLRKVFRATKEDSKMNSCASIIKHVIITILLFIFVFVVLSPGIFWSKS